MLFRSPAGIFPEGQNHKHIKKWTGFRRARLVPHLTYSQMQSDQIGTFGAKFEKFGTLRLELATKSPELHCQLFWHPFGTLQKFAKKFPKCLEIA